jgi:Ca-activated chloride channel family protein
MSFTLKTIVFLFIFRSFIWGDGFIVIPKPLPISPPTQPPSLFPLEVNNHQVNVLIENQFADTTIEQVFFNPTRHRLEGYYLFPVPTGAIIKEFYIHINGQETPAELLDAQKARQIYHDIVRRRRDPALLEYNGQDLFKVRIFPIEPLEKKKIKIRYRQMLTANNRLMEYIYPLNTEKFSAKSIDQTHISIRLKSDKKIKTLYCPSHQAQITYRSDTAAQIVYQEQNTRPNRDFHILYSVSSNNIEASILTHRQVDSPGFFLLNISPGMADHAKIAAKNIIFVLDVSGSMAGEKLIQAKKALLFCIHNLNDSDFFDIIPFSTQATSFFNQLCAADKKNRAIAVEQINQLQAIGGTNIEEALTLAMKTAKPNRHPTFVVFITDGKPTIGQTDENSILQVIKQKNNENTRIFTFGIGYDINTHLLDKISEETQAFRSYVLPSEDLEIKISDFYTKIQFPILSNIKISVSPNIQWHNYYPKSCPDIFKGFTITLIGRYHGSGDGTISIQGELNGIAKKIDIPCHFQVHALTHDFIPQLWAARQVGFLLDQIRLKGENQELIQEIIHLARQYGIITPYTSYLIVEDENVQIQQRQLQPNQTTLAPVAKTDLGFQQRNKQIFSNLKKKSGAAGISSSIDIQSLHQAENVSHFIQRNEKLMYKNEADTPLNLINQIRYIQGRAFYRQTNQWLDSRNRLIKNPKIIRLQFANDEYFSLLSKHPELSEILSIGKNIVFSLNNQLYEVYE